MASLSTRGVFPIFTCLSVCVCVRFYDKIELHFVFIRWNLVLFDVGFMWVIGCFPCWLLHLKKEKKKVDLCVFNDKSVLLFCLFNVIWFSLMWDLCGLLVVSLVDWC